MKKKTMSNIGTFLALPDDQKEAVAREFDREFVGDTFRPLTPQQRKAWNRAKRRMSRSRAVAARRISLSVPRDLLDRSDAYARKVGATRSELVTRGLQAVLAGKA